MPELGKVDRSFFETYIYPHLGADRDDVRLGPQHGVDFGVIDVDDQVVALATDPVFLMPALGFERAAWFAFHILLSDVAVSGLAPSHLSVDFNLPPEITDAEFETVWETFDREARTHDVAVVTGHTARYAGCTYPMVGGATVLGVGESSALVRPDGAEVGDRILITKGPAVEATALLSIQFREQLAAAVEPAVVDAATDRFYDMSPVTDARVAAAAGSISAMHDATECGVLGGLYEVARAGGVRLEIDRDRIPVLPGVKEACEFFEIDPWSSISEGTLLLSVPPDSVGPVLDALAAEGIPAADVGTVVAGSGVAVDGESVDHPETDPFWSAIERFGTRQE